MKKDRLFLVGYVLVCALFALTALEIGARVFLGDRYSRDERNLSYDYDPVLGWFPEKNSETLFKAARDIRVRHNGRGFRDVEVSPDKERFRIAFLGDSYVWGYDVDQKERFTEKLRRQMSDADIVNLGVSAFSTDQELLLLMREWDYFKPDFVFLMVSANDRPGNRSNMAYGYYKPYYRVQDGHPQLQGTPVPKNVMYRYKELGWGLDRSSLVMVVLKIAENLKEGRHFSKSRIEVPDATESLVGEMSEYLRKKQTAFAVALVDADEALARYCRERSIPLLDLSVVGDDYRFPSHGQHWDEKGHTRVAELVQQFLQTTPVGTGVL